MRLIVTPRVVAGTDRGGEDLFLDVVAEVEGNTPPSLEDIEVVGFNADLVHIEPIGDVLEEDDLILGKVKVTSPHYEFEWSGDGNDILDLVRDEFQNPKSWCFCHQHGEPERLRFYSELYIDGNAD